MECSRPDPTGSRAPSTSRAASTPACPLAPVRARAATWPLRSRALSETIRSSSCSYLQTWAVTHVERSECHIGSRSRSRRSFERRLQHCEVPQLVRTPDHVDQLDPGMFDC